MRAPRMFKAAAAEAPMAAVIALFQAVLLSLARSFEIWAKSAADHALAKGYPMATQNEVYTFK